MRAETASAHGACTGMPYGECKHEPPVAELVAEALDEQGLVGRHGAGGLLLLGDEVHQVLDGPGVEAGVLETFDERRVAVGLLPRRAPA